MDKGAYLNAVDELSERDILVMVEDGEGVEVTISTVLEPEPQEFAGFGRSTSAEFNSEDGTKVG